VNANKDRVKAVIIMRGHSAQGAEGQWQVVAFSACAGKEFDLADGRTIDNAPWVDASGNLAADIDASAGPAHCGWQSVMWFRYKGRQYLRDPLGVMDKATIAPFVADAAPPADLVQTGYVSRDRVLLTSTDNRFVWVRTSSSLERWSGVRFEPACS
jgi:hypothetical protein